MCKETGYENKMDEYTFSLTNVLMCKETGYENKMDEYALSLTNVLMYILCHNIYNEKSANTRIAYMQFLS
jgi:hypothetical protein